MLEGADDRRGRAFAIDAAPTDPFQQYVKHVVDGEKDWPQARGDTRESIETERRRLARELFDGAELVDLVGHSTPRSCYLTLGDWVLDPVEAERLGSFLPKSVKVVRLIGCDTARTKDGRVATAAFTRCGLEAYGTLNKVYTTHFDRNGVKRGLEAPPLLGFFPDGRGPQPTQQVALDWGPIAWLRRGARWLIAAVLALVLRVIAARATPRARIAGLLHRRAAAMPGLLTQPLLRFELADDSDTWTLEILFDFEYARFYSKSGPVEDRDLAYAIRGAAWLAKTPLEAYLERAPQGLVLTQRHVEAGDRCAHVPVR